MDIKRASCCAAYMLGLVIANAHAAPSEVCFESKADYEKYLAVGDGQASKPVKGDSETAYSFNLRMKEWQNNLPKRKSVYVKIQDTEKEPPLTTVYDGSGSTTPSGKATYKWEAQQETSNSQGTEAKFKQTGGFNGRIQLTVTDPVCETSDSGSMAVYRSGP